MCSRHLTGLGLSWAMPLRSSNHKTETVEMFNLFQGQEGHLQLAATDMPSATLCRKASSDLSVICCQCCLSGPRALWPTKRKGDVLRFAVPFFLEDSNNVQLSVAECWERLGSYAISDDHMLLPSLCMYNSCDERTWVWLFCFDQNWSHRRYTQREKPPSTLCLCCLGYEPIQLVSNQPTNTKKTAALRLVGQVPGLVVS